MHYFVSLIFIFIHLGCGQTAGQPLETNTSHLLSTPPGHTHIVSTPQRQSHPYFNSLKQDIDSHESVDRASVSSIFHSSGYTSRELTQSIDLIKNAQLTINFHTHRLFERPQIADGILSYYEVPVTRSSSDPHTILRNNVEQRIFGVTNPVIGNTSFQNRSGSSQRPIYAAPNINQLPTGAAHAYGGSYFILRENNKNLATLIPQDSFDRFTGSHLQTRDRLASYNNLYRLLVKMTPAQRLGIIQLVRSHPPYPLAAIYGDYIEVHIHAPIHWEDIQEIVLDANDVYTAPGLGGLSYPQILTLQRTIRQNAEDLRQRTGVAIRYTGTWPTP